MNNRNRIIDLKVLTNGEYTSQAYIVFYKHWIRSSRVGLCKI